MRDCHGPKDLAVDHPRRGHRHAMDLLNEEHCTIGTRFMKRLWRTEGLPVPQRRRKRTRIGTGENIIVRRRATRKYEGSGMDFVSDHTADGRPLRMLVVLDESIRKCLAIGVGRQCRAEDVVRVLDELTAVRSAPAQLRSDYGPEMISTAEKVRCAESGTGTLYIDPGSSLRNGIAEGFSGWLRDELLSSEFSTRRRRRGT